MGGDFPSPSHIIVSEGKSSHRKEITINSLIHSAAITRIMNSEHLCNGGPQDGKQCGCRLTQVQLHEANVGIFNECLGCGHKFGFHPAGPQGK